MGPYQLVRKLNRLSLGKPIKVFFAYFLVHKKVSGGDKRDRTVDPLLAKQVLSQLSYTPVSSRVRPLN